MEIIIYLTTFLLCLIHVDCRNGLRPIVIVPGIGGSQIEAKLNRNSTQHYWCYSKINHWFTIWLSIEELLPWAKYCWIDNIKLEYDEKAKTMVNTEGVETRVPAFGNTSAIEWLDPSLHGPGVYFYPLVDSLCRLMGYERGKNLRAAPYDFRLDPSSAWDYFIRLKQLIEETYHANNNQKVLLTSHSMGTPYTLYFLRNQTQEWKDTYLEAWVSISGVFAGSVKAILAYISGDGFGIPKILDNPFYLRAFQRTFSSLPFILPDPRFWGKDEFLVKTFNKSYTVNDFDDLFDDIGFPLAKKIRNFVPLPWHDEPPNIKMYCFHGREMETPGLLTYRKGYFPDYMPDITFDDGDGTVTARSLQACLNWKDKQQQPIIHQEFKRAEHNGILGDARFLRHFIDVIKSSNHHLRDD